MTTTILVLIGGAVGTGCRYGLSILIYSILDRHRFAWANFLINLSGSFAIGVLAEIFTARPAILSQTLQTALLVGVLGGYTTFSSFSLETLGYVQQGRWDKAILYSAGSVLLGLLAVWLGVRLGHRFN